jgi:site-specific DNA-methyltransferase (adenine-specific)
MKNHPIPRLDTRPELTTKLLPYCRLTQGEAWEDPTGQHRVACGDATDPLVVAELMKGIQATLAVHDPPYNLVAFQQRNLEEYVQWCQKWVLNTYDTLCPNSSFYVWLGADQTDGFQPLPDFMLMMRRTDFKPRSFITMRNQRGYGTQRNWMAVRQELLYYTKGDATFDVKAEYTDIPKILRGYYKDINGKSTENIERSKSENIRAGNVWVDIQQVFYRMEENVNGCYAQKPLKSCERILRASSKLGDVVIDWFSHSGATLLTAELLGRRCMAMDIDPVYCEISIRRLEHFRATGKRGWQNGNPFEREIHKDPELSRLFVAPEQPETVQSSLFVGA